MMNNRLIAGAVAGVLGVVFAIAAVFLGGVLSSEDSPATNVNSFNAEDGFVQGTVDYGTRDNAGVTN
ncbi:DUF2613 domain-containing protein [Williamsia sp.]|jgi:Protein of unknown function (DUF2613)|uniref:DUF2613 domain-containing protein n=1 Tax=Williamsia sp. TaxID=1872085 RepID=UPI002F94228D